MLVYGICWKEIAESVPLSHEPARCFQCYVDSQTDLMICCSHPLLVNSILTKVQSRCQYQCFIRSNFIRHERSVDEGFDNEMTSGSFPCLFLMPNLFSCGLVDVLVGHRAIDFAIIRCIQCSGIVVESFRDCQAPRTSISGLIGVCVVIGLGGHCLNDGTRSLEVVLLCLTITKECGFAESSIMPGARCTP
jgi:hypothetical protein